MNRLAFLAFLAATFTATPAIAAHPTTTPQAVTTEQTKVFGSDFIKLDVATQLDGKWEQAVKADLKPKTIAWAQTLSGKPVIERIAIVNSFVNRQIRYEADKVDVWKTAATTLTDGFGDCEDFALLKLALLEAAGIPRADLMLNIARHLKLRADHAMLIVRAGDKLLVLDNNTSAMLDGSQPGAYMPILTYVASGQKWSHTDVPGHIVVVASNHIAVPLAMAAQ